MYEDNFYLTHDERELVIECIEKEIKATEPHADDDPVYVAHAECKIENLRFIINRMREYL